MNKPRLVIIADTPHSLGRAAEMVALLRAENVRAIVVEGPLDAALRDLPPPEPLALDLPALDIPTWTEPSPRTDRRARRDPGGRAERRDYAGWGMGGRVPR